MARLYAKYELPYAYHTNNRYYEKVKQQYIYAKENLESLKRASGETQGDEAENLRNAIVSRTITFVKNLLYLGCAFFIFAVIFKVVSINTL